ncbi:MAG: radical SAM protein [Gammaproteobacteria bacterium]|nr:radical SAM protein [Gammaproteobacteria bacterium]
MSLKSILDSLEAYDGLEFDSTLLDSISQYNQQTLTKNIQFYLPTFKHFESDELSCSGSNEWPSISITGSECKLQCDHCKAKILEPMLAVTNPSELWPQVNRLIEQGAKGLLLSGGSNHRNEVEYGPYLSQIERIKHSFPEFQIAVHTALVNDESARDLEQAGVDVAMLDIIGAQETITKVYHLKRHVDDFEASLESLVKTQMRVVPHIVMGLHYGELLGESNALHIIERHAIDALVLVAIMPQYTSAKRPFKTPDPSEVGNFLLEARKCLPHIPVLLGCARPPGQAKTLIDAYAVMAGLDGIAHPAEGSVTLADALGRPHGISRSCCSISTTKNILSVTQTAASRRPLTANMPVELPVQWI